MASCDTPVSSRHLPLRKPKSWETNNIFNNYTMDIGWHDFHFARTMYISSVKTTNCRLYNNSSQILLLCKTWGYDKRNWLPEILGVYFWYVKIPQCGYMSHGLEYMYVTFYVQKHIAPPGICSNPPLVRDKPLGVPAFIRLAYWWAVYTVYLL